MTPTQPRTQPEKTAWVALYRLMLKIRLAEERVADLYPTDKIQSPVHLSVGQEAVSAGTCLALKPQDRLYSTYRGHGLYIAKGGDLGRMFAELYGKDTGCTRGKGGSMHLVAPNKGLMGCSAIVASTIPVAVGDALASHMQGRPRLVVSVFGDGAIDEGVFFESVNFALLKNLPVLFVLENNNYAIHSKVADRHRQPELFRIGEGLGLPGRRHDGNDAGEVYRAVRSAAGRIRAGGRPELLELMTHRWREHVGPKTDYEEAYHDPADREKSLKEDPLARARKELKTRWGVPEGQFARWERSALREIAKAVAFAEQSPLPGPERLFADLYAS